MSPGLRLVAACTVILFLVVAGLLGGLQDLNQNMRKDPVFATELHQVSFPIPGIAGAQPYQAMDLRDRFGWASVYLKSSEDPSDGVIMIVSRLPGENVRLDGDFDKGMNREWEAGSFEPLGSMREVNVQFRGQQHFAQLQVFQDETKALRHQILVGLPWGGQTVYVQANGPADLLTQASFQQALDGVVGEAQELVKPEPEAEPESGTKAATETEAPASAETEET